MVLMIDNYDSFTYNIVQYIRELGYTVEVRRNDELALKDISTLAPSHIVISPGPSNPNHAGISLAVIQEIKDLPVMGICLGHQCIGQAFGGKIIRSEMIYHGKSSTITHQKNDPLYTDIPSPFKAIRYHSLVIDPKSFPSDELIVTATSEDNEIMAVKHCTRPITGIQFHPESIGSEYGHELLGNFLKYYA